MTQKTLRETMQMASDALETLCSEMGEQARVLINQEAINQGLAALEALRAALALADEPVARDGYVLVPLELDAAMWTASRRAFLKFAREHEDAKTSESAGVVADIAAQEILNSMLAAAPHPAPVERKPLTDEQIIDLSAQYPCRENDWADAIDFARAIEAAHGIKEVT